MSIGDLAPPLLCYIVMLEGERCPTHIHIYNIYSFSLCPLCISVYVYM